MFSRRAISRKQKSACGACGTKRKSNLAGAVDKPLSVYYCITTSGSEPIKVGNKRAVHFIRWVPKPFSDPDLVNSFFMLARRGPARLGKARPGRAWRGKGCNQPAADSKSLFPGGDSC